MADLKNIVIIGGSISGHTLANNLVDKLPANHRILLIDALDFVVWPVASLRGAVVPGWEKRVHAPLQTEYVFSAGSIHQVIAPNKVIELKKSSVVLEKPFEGKTEIPFVKAVIATGASQPAPMRPAPGSTEAEYEALLKDYQRDLSKAKKVVVVGGGAAGTEVAGEIKHQFPSIDVTIVHSQSQILNPATKGLTPATNSDSKSKSWSAAPTPAKFSPPIEKKLKELKINLILNEKVQIPQSKTGIAVGEWDGSFGFQGQIKKLRLSSGKSVEADFVFLSVGNQANGSIVEKADSGAIVNGMGKMVDVDDYLKVQSSNPDSILTANYYAIGDVAASQEFKTSQTALANANIVTKNLLAELQGKPLKRYTPPGMHALVIPIGPDHVLGGLTVPYLGSLGLPNFMGKSAKGVRLMVEDYFYPIFKGAKPVPTAPLPAA